MNYTSDFSNEKFPEFLKQHNKFLDMWFTITDEDLINFQIILGEFTRDFGKIIMLLSHSYFYLNNKTINSSDIDKMKMQERCLNVNINYLYNEFINLDNVYEVYNIEEFWNIMKVALERIKLHKYLDYTCQNDILNIKFNWYQIEQMIHSGKNDIQIYTRLLNFAYYIIEGERETFKVEDM